MYILKNNISKINNKVKSIFVHIFYLYIIKYKILYILVKLYIYIYIEYILCY